MMIKWVFVRIRCGKQHDTGMKNEQKNKAIYLKVLGVYLQDVQHDLMVGIFPKFDQLQLHSQTAHKTEFNLAEIITLKREHKKLSLLRKMR